MEPAIIPNESTQTAPSIGSAKNRMGLYVLLTIVLLVLVVGLTSFTGTRADFSALQKHAVPIDEKGLAKSFPQMGANAAQTYLDALDKIDSWKPDERNHFSYVDVSSAWAIDDNYRSLPEMRKSARIVLFESAKNRGPFIDLLMNASRQNRCVLEDPIFVRGTPEEKFARKEYGYSRIPEAVSYLGGMAIIQEMKGDQVGGLMYLGDAKNVVHQLSMNPGSESFGAWRLAADNYFRCWSTFAKLTADDPSAQKEVAYLSADLPMASIKWMAAGDFPDNLETYRNAQKYPDQYKYMVMMRTDDQITDFKPFMRQGVNEVIHEWRNVFDSLPDTTDDYRSCEAVFQNASDDFQSRYPAKDVLRNPFKEYIDDCKGLAEVLAKKRIMRVASEIMTIRLQTQRAPEALPQDHEHTIDPFTGKPLIYYKEGKGFKLYSVGPDGLDNTVHNPAAGRLSDDIVFELEDPRMRPDIPMTDELRRESMTTFFKSQEERRAFKARPQ